MRTFQVAIRKIQWTKSNISWSGCLMSIFSDPSRDTRPYGENPPVEFCKAIAKSGFLAH
jgi:hypothetical protein